MKITQWYDREERTPVTPEDQAEDWWCPTLRAAILDRETMLNYVSNHRMYMIIDTLSRGPLIDFEWGVSFVTGKKFKKRKRYVTDGVSIEFCPFCGARFPGVLSDELDRLLAGKGLLDEEAADHVLPDLYLSNAWWKDSFSTHPGQFQEVRPPCPKGRERSISFDPAYDCPHTVQEFEMLSSGLVYVPHLREFGIRQVDVTKGLYEQPLRYRRSRFSPWCGERYPRTKRYDRKVLLASLEIPEDCPYMPEMLLSDYWWKNIASSFYGDNSEQEDRDDLPPPERCTPPASQLPMGPTLGSA